MTFTPTVTKEKAGQTITQHYPNYKIIVLNDDFNTFPHVIECLMKYIPGINYCSSRKNSAGGFYSDCLRTRTIGTGDR